MSGILVILLALWCSCHARHIYNERFPETESEVAFKPLTFQKPETKTVINLPLPALKMAKKLYGTVHKAKPPISVVEEPESDSTFSTNEVADQVKSASYMIPQALKAAENLYGTLQKTKKPKEPAKNGTEKVAKRAANHEDFHIEMKPPINLPQPALAMAKKLYGSVHKAKTPISIVEEPESDSSVPARELITVTDQVKVTSDLLPDALEMAKKLYETLQKMKTPENTVVTNVKETAKNGTEKIMKRATNHEDVHIDLAPSESLFPTRELVTVADQDDSPFPTNEFITVTDEEMKPAINLPHQALEMAKGIYDTFQELTSPESVVEETGFTIV
ncbi:uncharacterized protein O3C94_006546 isoform 2-T2 [Discoglossus pictus]